MSHLINQFTMDFTFTTNKSMIEKKKKDYANVYRIDGELKLEVNGEVFFQEDIAILEFYLQLKKWFSKKVNNSFYYHTLEVEDDENPIIKFVAVGDNYSLSSPWSQGKLVYIIEASLLEKTVESFVEDFSEKLDKHFSLKTKWFE
ncbi:DUF7878 domain-containing protein [Cerasibacillus sp. JNUCC 74]